MGKTKRALLNTVATMLQMIVAQIISLFVSRKVLEVYGSDLNGVNAILSNMMEWILLLEGVVVLFEFTIPTFCLVGVVLALTNAALVFLVVFLFERQCTKELITRLKSTVRRS